MYKTIKILSMAGVIAAIIFSISCKKGINNNKGNSNMPDTANSTMKDRLYDTMYMYALQTYYWNSQLPTYASFLPRQYENTSDSLGLANEMFAYTRIPKDANGKIYEQRISFDEFGNSQPDNSEPKYSNIEYTSATMNGGAGSFVNTFNTGSLQNIKMTLDGKDSSLGFIVGFLPANYSDDSVSLVKDSIAKNYQSYVCVVRYVIKGSPADLQGLKRGSIISSINHEKYDFGTSTNPNKASFNAAQDAIFSNSISLSVFDPKTEKNIDLSMQAKLYTFNPIFKSIVLTFGSHKIGYLAFQSFTDISNAQPVLDSAFRSYAAQDITDIIIDLRYNGGGYVNAAEHLVDLITPSSSSGKTMYTAYYNQTMVNKQATILKNVPVDYNNPSQGKLYDIDFSPTAQTTKITKSGGVSNLTKVYFIVSSGTASASELVINSLKPYVKETLIGAKFSDYGKYTYGKPVGFFELRVGKFSIWTPNFATRNANNQGDYYQGFPTDYQDFDDITHDFGDPKEECLARAIYLISGVNTYTTSYARTFNSINVQRAIMQTRAIGNPIKISDMVIKPKRNFGN